MTTRPCCSPGISSAESLTRASGLQNLLGTAFSRSRCFRPGKVFAVIMAPVIGRHLKTAWDRLRLCWGLVVPLFPI